MRDKVQLVIHHGGNFIKYPVIQYVNGKVYAMDYDPNLISYPYLLKCITVGQYGRIESLSFKLPQEPLEMLRTLWNHSTTLDLIRLLDKLGKCNIYVEHGD